MDHHTDAADQLEQLAREVIDSNRYLVLGTVEDAGHPRVSPVYFGHDGYRDFYWVSRSDSLHSVNLEQRPTVNAVVYDSSVQVGDGRAVYVTGKARRVSDAELPERSAVAFRPHLGGRAFAPDELTGDATLRLYVLTAEVWEVHVGGDDPRFGTGRDRRARIWPAGPA
jgi:hypothetical protein